MTKDTETNKALVADFLATFSEGDVDGVLARLHESATWWVSGTIPGMSGTYEKTRFGDLLRGVGDVYVGGAMRFTPLTMLADGDGVAVEAESFAELRNGRIYRNRYHLLFQFADGKILRVKEYMDTQHAFDTFVAP